MEKESRGMREERKSGLIKILIMIERGPILKRNQNNIDKQYLQNRNVLDFSQNKVGRIL